MKNMKRILSLVLTLATILGCFGGITVFAADETLTISEITASEIVAYKTNPESNMVDGSDATYTLFNIANEKPTIDLSFADSTITKISIATKNFIAWRNIKTVKATLSNGASETIELPDCGCDTVGADFTLAGENITGLQIEVLEFYDNSQSSYCAINEIAIIGEQTKVGLDGVRRLEYTTDFTIPGSSGIAPDGNWAYWFDGNASTRSNMGPVFNSYIVFQFAYPTDVSRITFIPTVNGDWSVPTAVEFEVYNGQTKYRKSLKNPSPEVMDGRYSLKVEQIEQQVDLSGKDMMKGITHLIVKIPETYVFKEASTWGGFTEVGIYGKMHTDKTSVAEMITYEQVSAIQLLRDMGITPALSEGETNVEYMKKRVNRLEAMEILLRFTGEYDKAMAFEGTYNYDDANEVPEYKNLLSYVYAYQGKYPFYQSGSFQPNMYLTMKEWYVLLLGQLGYVYGEDFTDDTLQDALFELGMGDCLYSPELNLKELSISLYELLGQNYKGTEETVISRLQKNGVAGESDVFRFYTKYDNETKASNGSYNQYTNKWCPVDTDGTFSFSRQEHPKLITDEHFIFNSAYHLELITRGILPESDPQSLRKEFAEALHESGVRGFRFPGGTPAHTYFIEGYDYDAKLWHMRNNEGLIEKMGGNFTPIEGKEDNFHADFWNWLDFSKENDLTTYFQINLYWYVDPDTGEIYPTIPSRWTHDLSGKAKLYDGKKRIAEGAAVFAKHLDEIKERGYEIDVWEMGNEDFHWVTYTNQHYSYNTEDMHDNYYDVVAAYTKEIIKRWPDAKIVYTTMSTDNDQKEEYESRGVWQYLAGSAHHYPFGSWNAPPAAEKTDIKRFVYTNDMNMVKWASAAASHYEGYENGDYVPANAIAKQGEENMITETILYRHEAWDCYSLNDKFGHALNTIKNMGEGLFETPWSVFVVHEIESSYFGWIKYDKIFIPQTRKTRTAASYDGLYEDVPEAYNYRYKLFVNPSAKALQMLNGHINNEVLADTRTSVGRHLAAFASENTTHDEVTITLVNRHDEALPVEIKLSEWEVAAQTADVRIMQSNYLWAMLDEEYNDYMDKIEVKGNADGRENNAIEFTMQPYSIYHLKVKVK